MQDQPQVQNPAELNQITVNETGMSDCGPATVYNARPARAARGRRNRSAMVRSQCTTTMPANAGGPFGQLGQGSMALGFSRGSKLARTNRPRRHELDHSDTAEPLDIHRYQGDRLTAASLRMHPTGAPLLGVPQSVPLHEAVRISAVRAFQARLRAARAAERLALGAPAESSSLVSLSGSEVGKTDPAQEWVIPDGLRRSFGLLRQRLLEPMALDEPLRPAPLSSSLSPLPITSADDDFKPASSPASANATAPSKNLCFLPHLNCHLYLQPLLPGSLVELLSFVAALEEYSRHQVGESPLADGPAGSPPVRSICRGPTGFTGATARWPADAALHNVAEQSYRMESGVMPLSRSSKNRFQLLREAPPPPPRSNVANAVIADGGDTRTDSSTMMKGDRHSGVRTGDAAISLYRAAARHLQACETRVVKPLVLLLLLLRAARVPMKEDSSGCQRIADPLFNAETDAEAENTTGMASVPAMSLNSLPHTAGHTTQATTNPPPQAMIARARSYAELLQHSFASLVEGRSHATPRPSGTAPVLNEELVLETLLGLRTSDLTSRVYAQDSPHADSCVDGGLDPQPVPCPSVEQWGTAGDRNPQPQSLPCCYATTTTKCILCDEPLRVAVPPARSQRAVEDAGTVVMISEDAFMLVLKISPPQKGAVPANALPTTTGHRAADEIVHPGTLTEGHPTVTIQPVTVKHVMSRAPGSDRLLPDKPLAPPRQSALAAAIFTAVSAAWLRDVVPHSEQRQPHSNRECRIWNAAEGVPHSEPPIRDGSECPGLLVCGHLRCLESQEIFCPQRAVVPNLLERLTNSSAY